MALNKTWQNLSSTTEPARCAVLFNIRISLSLFLLALASSSYCAEISDSVIKLDAQTSATYSEPKMDPPEACVLMIHGWTSTMDEVGGLYKSLATQLAEAGLASLRVQIPGESRALGNRLTSRFDERVASSTLALEYLSTRCSDKKIGLVGFSLGGATAMVLAGNYPERIHSLVLWSSATRHCFCINGWANRLLHSELSRFRYG